MNIKTASLKKSNSISFLYIDIVENNLLYRLLHYIGCFPLKKNTNMSCNGFNLTSNMTTGDLKMGAGNSKALELMNDFRIFLRR